MGFDESSRCHTHRTGDDDTEQGWIGNVAMAKLCNGMRVREFLSGLKPRRESETNERRAQPVDEHYKIGVGDILK